MCIICTSNVFINCFNCIHVFCFVTVIGHSCLIFNFYMTFVYILAYLYTYDCLISNIVYAVWCPHMIRPSGYANTFLILNLWGENKLFLLYVIVINIIIEYTENNNTLLTVCPSFINISPGNNLYYYIGDMKILTWKGNDIKIKR